MAELVEIAGIFLIVVGFGAVVAAASMVSTALAVLVFGAFAVFSGVIIVYAVNATVIRQHKQAAKEGRIVS